MNRLKEIRNKEWCACMPAFSKEYVSKDDVTWLTLRVLSFERIAKITKEALKEAEDE